MNIDETIALVKKTPTEEVLTEKRLRRYLEENVKMKHYIGFEISGYVHIGTGLICMQKIADLQRANIDTIVFLADYHSWINRKLGGDLDTIRRVAGGYFKEALKQSLKIVGGNPDKTKFIMGTELYEKVGIKYFEHVLRISMETKLSRIRRSISIMGRRMGEALDFAQLLYVPMQVADIFTLEVNLPHGGMDQRKAHVIAIDVGNKIFGYKPVALHHHVLMGLDITSEGYGRIIRAKKRGEREALMEEIIERKMSKSRPKSAIFIHDGEEEIKRKILKAFCPMGDVEMNPIMELMKYLIIRYIDEGGIEIVNRKTGERKVFESYSDLEIAYKKGRIHPLDLKEYVAEKLIEILKPARKYFTEGNGRKFIEEMKEIMITR
ncbi:MAG: tyrosine--tRNA ligase [archaeon GB-1867-097]|nr:tyrosine--tRNA ligase [Candidatus Culexmicrobium thermophilum]MCS7384489.1 tyrosine--tRNA ligase [Candidatus Culexmicrobium thermophilum]HDO21071.1 tyrosine--tRNA ligase [Candidatus Bathyarchaeota archaeon]